MMSLEPNCAMPIFDCTTSPRAQGTRFFMPIF